MRRLALGFSYSLAAGAHGAAASWGTDDHGCLGQGFLWPRPGSPSPSPLPVRLAAVAAGWRHAAGADADGRLFAWGWGGAPGGGGLMAPDADLGAGQLGLGEDRDVHDPTQVQRLSLGGGAYRDTRQRGGGGGEEGVWRVLEVAAGRNHTAAVVELEAAAADIADG